VKLATVFFSLAALFGLSACDQLSEQINKQKDNGKAIGAACRHSGRALEDCYRRNSKTPKADIYAGWREMNEYMLSKRIDIVPPPPDQPEPAPAIEEKAHEAEASSASAVKDAKKPVKSGH
jgi:hypothetical protein